jgi:hypothetical protein
MMIIHDDNACGCMMMRMMKIRMMKIRMRRMRMIMHDDNA